MKAKPLDKQRLHTSRSMARVETFHTRHHLLELLRHLRPGHAPIGGGLSHLQESSTNSGPCRHYSLKLNSNPAHDNVFASVVPKSVLGIICDDGRMGYRVEATTSRKLERERKAGRTQGKPCGIRFLAGCAVVVLYE